MILHLNGLPGIGKLTVARHLEALLKAEGRDVRLVDNHAVINLCYAVTDYGTPLYREMVRDLADRLLAFMVQAPQGRTFIFTNALVEENENNGRRYESIRQLAANRGDAFVPIHLVCSDEAEHLRRATSDARKQHQKLTEATLVQAAARKTVIHDPAAPHALSLDIGTLSAEAAAAAIAEYVKAI